jgi:leucyl aminopeptidase
MEFSVKSGNAEKQRTGCVVVAVFEKRRLSPAAERLDAASQGMLGSLIRRGDLNGKLGQSLLLHNVPGTLADRVLVMGCGRERDMGDGPYFKVIGQAMTALQGTGSTDAVSYLTDVPLKGRDTYWKVRQAVVRSREALYRFDRLKSDKADRRRPLKRLTLSVSGRKELADGERAVEHGMALANGIDLAKELANLPANICTPGYLAGQAGELAKPYPVLKVQVLEQKDMEALGMGALLAVARGSQEPPKFIILEYRGTNEEGPVALVGKGVTFDSGGISIKPAQYMDEMKYDMSGAATVLGVMRTVAELALPIDLVGLIPTTENLPSGSATKPGDVVTSLSGQTIEVLNTDAEGRLILCDALSYAERYKPCAVIDIATLTGACVIALGQHASGLFSSQASLANELLSAGRYTGDRAWELPLWEDYQEQLKSNFADVANIGGREAGAITAASFLARFTKKYHWAHLDIAGTAWKTGKDKGATGRPVALLVQFLLQRAAP